MVKLTVFYDIVGLGSFALRVSVLNPNNVPANWGDVVEIAVDDQTGPGTSNIELDYQLQDGFLLRFHYVPGEFETGPSGPTAETSWLQCVIDLTGAGVSQVSEWL